MPLDHLTQPVHFFAEFFVFRAPALRAGLVGPVGADTQLGIFVHGPGTNRFQRTPIDAVTAVCILW